MTEDRQKRAEAVEEAVKEAKEQASQEASEAEETADANEEAETPEMQEEEVSEETTDDGKTREPEDTGDGAAGKQKEKRRRKKDKKEEEIADLKDRLIRQMAEFDNFRKRTDKEKSHMYEYGAKDILEKILPVVDSFERGLGAVTDEQKDDPFAGGMEMIYKQLMTVLEGAGVTVIPAVGEKFDPNLHNAVMHVDDDSDRENEIVEEFQKGYKYKDSVLRYSMVKVVN